MRDEAQIDDTPSGRMAADDGWFILNLTDIGWETVEGGGTWCIFESPAAPSPTLGVGAHILNPGESSGFYHEESEQEGFLVLSGTCIAIVEGRERAMGPGDYLHSPPGTRHMIVGAGDGPCALFMVGTRSPDSQTLYPVDQTAARHGVSVAVETTSAREAYAERPPIRSVRSPWPLA